MKLSDLKKVDDVPGDCGNPMDKVPEWMDFERFRRGREFFYKHCAAVFLAMHCSLVTGLSIINLLQPLVFTEQSNTAEKAYNRYFQTFLHIALWHYDDVWDAPNGRAHKSVKLVRRMHTSIAARMNKDRNPSGDSSKLFFSQYDMALVQAGFFGAVVRYPKGFGIKCTTGELDDYVFFWRGMGYLLGVDDRYNLCKGTFEEACSIVREIEQELLLPALRYPPKDFEMMSEAYVEGSNRHVKRRVMTKEAIFALVSEGMGLMMPKLTMLDYLRFLYLKTIIFLTRWCPYFERVLNIMTKKLFYDRVHQLRI
jgi:hypothetical protein